MSLQGFYTTKGLALAAKLAAGTGLTITRVTAGSGETAESAAALAQERQTLTVGEAAVSGQSAVLPTTLAEAGASAAYTLTELGVYARDPQEGEILYQVFRLSEGRAITAGGGSAYRFYLKQTVGAAGVTVTCSPAGLLTGEDLQPLRTALARKPDAVQGNITLHVAKTGNDTTGDGSESKPYLTIQKALSSLPKLLLARADIVIHGGTYEEAVLVYGFSGPNSLTIGGAENETVKIKTVDIRAVNLAEAVQLRNVELVGTSEDGYNFSVRTGDSGLVILENVSCTNATASSHWGAFRFEYTLFARLTGCTISNKAVALDVAAAVVYMDSTVTGTGNTVGIRCGSGWGNAGGYVQKGGANIAGEEQKGFGGQIW